MRGVFVHPEEGSGEEGCGRGWFGSERVELLDTEALEKRVVVVPLADETELKFNERRL